MKDYMIVRQDAFSFLEKLPNASVDLIVSSPPYFMGKEYDRSDSVQDFLAEHVRLRPLLLSALREGGSICWQVGSHVKDNTVTPLDALVFSAFSCNELQLRNRIIWTFGHGAHSTKRFSGRHETILWYTKGRGYHFDLDSVRTPQKYPGKRHYKGPKRGEYSGNPLGKNPTDVWEIPNVNANHIEKTAHPCQFPVALIQRLVRALTPKGGLVIDPFAGSASAGVAALLEGRRFMGCDLKREYVEIAQQRLRQTANGEVKWRDVDRPILIPDPSTQVATRPEHFVRPYEKA